jgi:hypothetical protein
MITKNFTKVNLAYLGHINENIFNYGVGLARIKSLFQIVPGGQQVWRIKVSLLEG